MAEFYAGTRLSPDGAELGVAEAGHRRVLAEHAILPLSELLLADESWPLSAAPRDNAVFYAQSWALVHYLVAARGSRGHELLAAYMGALLRGEDRLGSFEEVFGSTLEEVESELHAYIEKGDFRELHFDLSEVEWSRGLSYVELEPARVQHRWGELFLFTDRPKEARVCLEEALRLDPELGEAWETLGIADWMDGRKESAERKLKRAADLGEASPSGLYHYARVLLDDHSGHGVHSLPNDVAVEAELALTRSLTMNPAQSETARLLAFVYLVRGTRLDEATELVESALEMSPGRASLLYLYGQLLARRGEYERAREALGRVQADAEEPSLREAASELLSRMEAGERAPGSN